MTSTDELRVEVADRVATVTLHRPDARNALNRALRGALRAAWIDLDRRDDVDVIVLTGADPAFCAGLDLKELSQRAPASAADGGGAADERAGADPEAGRGPWRGPVPPTAKLVIGAVNGVAITGGFELALTCDFLVASERARFADTHARVGLMPGWGLTVRLTQLIGTARAKELSATGNFLDAPTALAWGLVNHVVAHEELLPTAHALARACCEIDQRAVRRMLATYDEIALTTLEEGWAIEGRVSDDWQRDEFDPAGVARRRADIQARGRSQL